MMSDPSAKRQLSVPIGILVPFRSRFDRMSSMGRYIEAVPLICEQIDGSSGLCSFDSLSSKT
jgi:hypothetical protein